MERFKVLCLGVIMATNGFSQNVNSINNDTAIIDTVGFSELSIQNKALSDSVEALCCILDTKAVFYYNDFYGNYQFIKNKCNKDIKYLWITFRVSFVSYNIEEYHTLRYDNLKRDYYYENEPYSEALKDDIFSDIEPCELAKVQWKDGTYSTIKLFFIKKEYLWTLR